ncbi:MAG: glycerophosphodiester phosphodiesterase [Anaerolineae bacterium]|jgi:glycerophosphoryl diester phosphodiesterase|nr:glycerophosphodiester phosphodiesterase [Anaerolineae bacterium]
MARTLVFGHRGASAYAPQNTLPSFQLALDQQVDGIEFDVHLSSDGIPVVFHDFVLDHLTDGTGLIHEKSLADLKQLDAGGKFGAQFAGVRIPTLAEVFELVGDRVILNVEIKSRHQQASRLIGEVIHQFGLQSQVIVSSFDLDTLSLARQAMPDIAIGVLHEAILSDEHLKLIEAIRPQALHPYYQLLFHNTDYVTTYLNSAFQVNTWTVNDPAHAQKLQQLGVNAVMTDYPDLIRAALV